MAMACEYLDITLILSLRNSFRRLSEKPLNPNLPIAKEPEFEKCFATPQSFNLSSLCEAFHVDYSLLSSWSQIIEKLIKPRDRGIEVIEIRTNRKQDRLTRNKLLALTPWKDA